MTECIIIASWMLPVVGFALLSISIYGILKGYARDDSHICLGPFIAMAFAIGLVSSCVGLSPYIPDLSNVFVWSWPCIQVIP